MPPVVGSARFADPAHQAAFDAQDQTPERHDPETGEMIDANAAQRFANYDDWVSDMEVCLKRAGTHDEQLTIWSDEIAPRVEAGEVFPDDRDRLRRLLIIRDGDPGEPDVLLSPLIYVYEHRVPVEIAPFASATLTREQALDQMLSAIGSVVAADRTLGRLCDFIESEAPTSDDLETTGAISGRWADAAIIASYATPNPLT